MESWLGLGTEPLITASIGAEAAIMYGAIERRWTLCSVDK
jgi:hypothetical protein